MNYLDVSFGELSICHQGFNSVALTMLFLFALAPVTEILKMMLLVLGKN